MPKLSEIPDVEELDNLYADKIIIYVEGTDDKAVFTELIGPNHGDQLEFKVPEESGSGYHTVRNRVFELRKRNKKIHGLLDGEAAASLGHVEEFINAKGVLFTVPVEALEGLYFLFENELENLLLCHVDVAEFINQNVPFGQIGVGPVDQIRADLTALSRRFYALTMLRFAAGEIHRGGKSCPQVDDHAKLFQGPHSVATILKMLKVKIEAHGIVWIDFMTRVHAVIGAVQGPFKAPGYDNDQRVREIVRLADGKEMLKRVRTKYNNGGLNWEGLLVERLKRSDYADDFTKALLRATSAV